MIASSAKNVNKHGAIILQKQVIQTTPRVAINIQSITGYGLNRAKVVLATFSVADIPLGGKVKISSSGGFDGVYTVSQVNYTDSFIIIDEPNIDKRASQSSPAGTVELYGAVVPSTVPGTRLENDDNELIAMTYNSAGSFIVRKGEDSLAIQLVVTSGSISASFQASLDGLAWATLSTTMTSVTASAITFFNDMPEGTLVKVNASGTGTYYLLARG